MHSHRPWLPILVSLVFSATAFGQQFTSQPAQAISILQNSVRSLIGTPAVTDVSISATAQRIVGPDDETGTATLTAMAAGESKVSVSLPSGVFIEVRTPLGTPPSGAPAGATAPAGTWSGPDGAPHNMATHNLLSDATWFFPAFSISRLLSAPGYVVSYIGQESRDGQQVLHLSACQQSWPAVTGQSAVQVPALIQHLTQMDLYLDPATLLPVALAFDIHPDNNATTDIPTEIRFSDYRTLGGAQVPFHVQRYIDNSLSLDLTLGSVTFNTELSPTSFAIQ